jgi:DNA helicase-2/ATP-dependent DNA helicase PcrA
LSCGPATKKVAGFYERLIAQVGPELEILMNVPLARLRQAGGSVVAEAVGRMRRNQVIREGGYDGQFGVMHLFENSEREAVAEQMALFAHQDPKLTRRGNTPSSKKLKHLLGGK